MNRCKWAMNVNEIYTKYHDEEWGEPVHDDQKLYEMLILESFQAGLSWSCILNKRENNEGIIRNKLKIKATINNSKIFKEIQKEYGSFDKYIWSFTNNETIYEFDKVSSELSDLISRDLKKRGMTFVGTIIIYSYLQAVGIINSHEIQCFKHCKI